MAADGNCEALGEAWARSGLRPQTAVSIGARTRRPILARNVRAARPGPTMPQRMICAVSELTRLAEQIFERGAQVGLLVAVLHDDGGVEAEAPFLAFALRDGARAGDDDRVLRE